MAVVSIITPYYNSDSFIEKAYQSILKQTLVDWEWIIVNDGSNAESRQFIEDLVFNEPRITLLHQNNKGQGSARNLGATFATGRYISFLDSDDWFHECKLEEQVHLITSTNASVIFTGIHEVAINNEESRMKEVSIPRGKGTKIYKDLIASNRYILSSCLINKQDFESVGGFTEKSMFRGVEDYHLWLKLAKYGMSFDYIDEKLTYYLVREDSEMSNLCGQYEGTLMAIEDVVDNDENLAETVDDRFRNLVPSLLLRSLQTDNISVYLKWTQIANQRKIPVLLAKALKLLPFNIRKLLLSVAYKSL